MRYRTLGATGLEASVIGLGGNRISEAPDRKETRATLDLALERGVNVIDLADCYGHGNCERLVGAWLGNRRENVILCSKVGARPPYSVVFDRWIDPIRRWVPSRPERHAGKGSNRPGENFAPRVMRAGIEGSLRRLGTDCLDVLYLHGPPLEVVVDGEVFAALESEKQAGRIRHYGVSFGGAATSEEVLACLEQPGLSIIQVRVNVASTVDLGRIGPVAREAEVAIVAREALMKGRLLAAGGRSGGAVGSSSLEPSASTSRSEGSAEAKSRARTLLQAVLQRPEVDTLLVGTTGRAHLEENLAALEAPPLTDTEMTELWSSTEVR